MNRRIWTGVLAGVLAAMVVLGVAAGAYRAGRHHEVVRETPDGEVVRVGGGYGWGYGPGPGFFLFPVLGIVAIALLVSARGGGRYGWHPPHGPGPWGHGGPESAFQDWHRRAHEGAGAPTGPGPGPSSGGTPTPPPG